MFNKAELAIFQRVGLTPVFFAQTVVGHAEPDVYAGLPDKAGRKAAWDRFRADPEWKTLRPCRNMRTRKSSLGSPT